MSNPTAVEPGNLSAAADNAAAILNPPLASDYPLRLMR
jgi:hypothetical protein